MTAHEIHALSGAYAVDALDDDERAQFEEHLAACTACQDEVASLREATAVLAELSAVAPAPELRDAVLADIRKVRPLPPLGSATVIAPRRPRWTSMVAAAAAVVAVLGGGTALVHQLTTEGTQQPSAADQVLQARDVQHVRVALPHDATATLYRSASLGRAVLVTSRMPAAPHGRVWELWLRRDGHMVPAGLMSGGGDQVVVLAGGLDGVDGAGITAEPAGGSPHPTTTPVALFDFRQAT